MKRITTFCMIMLLPMFLMAQTSYKFSEQSTIKIDGTSSLHDWSMLAKGVQGEALLTIVSGKITDIKKLKLNLEAESLKSGKAAMDKNAYSALKTDKHAAISFKLSTINSIEQKGDEALITATGLLNIAGTSKPEKIEAVCKINQDGSLQIKGSKQLVMSQYGVEPPSFMFGSVTTGDKITLSFTITLVPNQHQIIQ